MLEQKDLEMIAAIVEKANKPILQRLDRVEKTNESVLERLDRVEKTNESVLERLDSVEKTNESVLERLGKVEDDVSGMRLTIENEINKKINIIAEGHCDLRRMFCKALEVENEKEMMYLRIISLEGKVRDLQTRMDEIA